MITVDARMYDDELLTMDRGFKSQCRGAFDERLYFLLSTADTENRERIRLGYPVEVFIYETYHLGLEKAAARSPLVEADTELTAQLGDPLTRGSNRIDDLLTGTESGT